MDRGLPRGRLAMMRMFKKTPKASKDSAERPEKVAEGPQLRDNPWMDSCHVKQKDPLTLRSIGIESTGIAMARFIMWRNVAHDVKVFFLG